MEDAHTHILSLPDDKEASFFAVYDGHGGKMPSGVDTGVNYVQAPKWPSMLDIIYTRKSLKLPNTVRFSL